MREYEEIKSISLELEYALKKPEDSAIHLENSVKFLESDKNRNILTKELLSQFLAMNQEIAEYSCDFSF